MTKIINYILYKKRYLKKIKNMTDIITKYKKHKKMNSTFIVLTSLVLALSINFIVFNWNNLSKSLKTSVIDSENNKKSDLYIISNSGSLSIKTNKVINQVKNITLSMIYNPENIVLSDISTKNNIKISNLSWEAWISTILIDFEKATNLSKQENIFTISLSKKTNKSEQINLINANFTDEAWETYLFSTSGITF